MCIGNWRKKNVHIILVNNIIIVTVFKFDFIHLDLMGTVVAPWWLTENWPNYNWSSVISIIKGNHKSCKTARSFFFFFNQECWNLYFCLNLIPVFRWDALNSFRLFKHYSYLEIRKQNHSMAQIAPPSHLVLVPMWQAADGFVLHLVKRMQTSPATCIILVSVSTVFTVYFHVLFFFLSFFLYEKSRYI